MIEMDDMPTSKNLGKKVGLLWKIHLCTSCSTKKNYSEAWELNWIYWLCQCVCSSSSYGNKWDSQKEYENWEQKKVMIENASIPMTTPSILINPCNTLPP